MTEVKMRKINKLDKKLKWQKSFQRETKTVASLGHS